MSHRILFYAKDRPYFVDRDSISFARVFEIENPGVECITTMGKVISIYTSSMDEARRIIKLLAIESPESKDCCSVHDHKKDGKTMDDETTLEAHRKEAAAEWSSYRELKYIKETVHYYLKNYPEECAKLKRSSGIHRLFKMCEDCQEVYTSFIGHSCEKTKVKEDPKNEKIENIKKTLNTFGHLLDDNQGCSDGFVIRNLRTMGKNIKRTLNMD